MGNNESSNRTIAKNTILLYIRMFITMCIGLYTSRVVLNALGFIDYGIYNLVGGLVTMLSFLNVGLTSASQRFISYEIGKGDTASLKKVFYTAVTTHKILAVIVVTLLEIIGLLLINFKLEIPDDRIFAANWVFQCSLISTAVSIISVPYTSCVVAHEKMGQFAYISILETFLKLGVALIIMVSSIDKLILYSTLILVTHVIVRLIYTTYCKRKFEECTLSHQFDRDLFKKMFSFAGWGCIGNMGWGLKDQLSSIILNLFFGATINAARGIATQVNGIINSFASNFTMAMNPQITKQYAAGNIERSVALTISGSKYAFYLLSLITIPFLINEHYILRLWLKEVPEYTDAFVVITLISSCVYSMSHTVSTAIQATGYVKWFQILLAATLLLEVPLAYIILTMGGAPYMAVLPSIFTCLLSLIVRIIILHHYVPQYRISEYIVGTIVRGASIFAVAYTVSYFIKTLFTESLSSLFVTVFISAMIVIICVFILGLNNKERNMIINKISGIVNKIIK